MLQILVGEMLYSGLIVRRCLSLHIRPSLIRSGASCGTSEIGCSSFVNGRGFTKALKTEKLVDVDPDRIPTVDLAKPVSEVLAQIQQAADCGGPGFFYLMNHGIPQTVFDEAIAAAHLFYTGRSTAEKQAYSCLHKTSDSAVLSDDLKEKLCVGTKGYVKPGIEGAYKKDAATDVRPEDVEESGQKNTRESYVLRYPNWKNDGDLIANQPYTNAGSYAAWRKEWEAKHSTGPPLAAKDGISVEETVQLYSEASKFFFLTDQPLPKEFDPAVSIFLQEMRELSKRMMGYFLRLVRESSPENKMLEIEADLGMATFNITHYPATEGPGDGKNVETFGISDHTDWEFFTLLYPAYLQQKHLDLIAKAHGIVAKPEEVLPENPHICAETGVSYTGLEVWFQDQWVQVPHRPGCLIVNQGEMVSRLSNGRFAAPVHRVAGVSASERYSLVSFWAANYNTPLPDPIKGKVPVGEHYLLRSQLMDIAYL